MAFNIANALQQNYPDAIGIDQLKRRNALAEQDQKMQMQQATNQNALAQAQLGQITRQNSLQDDALAAQKQNEAHQVAYGYAQNLASIKDPAQFQQLAQAAAADPRVQSLGIDISHITPDNVQSFLAQARGSMGQAPFEQTPEYLKIQAQSGIKNQELETEHNYRLSENGAQQRGTKPQLVDVAQPDGSTQKQWIQPGQTTGTSVGAPEPAKPGMGAGRVQVMVGRITLAGNEIARSAENIMRLPMGANAGILGIGKEQGHGIMNSMKAALSNTVSPEVTRSYTIMVSGVKRNLAAIEAAGNMPPGSLTNQMSAVELQAGDSGINTLQRMAEIRQIADAGLESMLTQPSISKQQIEQIQGIRSKISKAIPFTQEDIQNFQQSDNPRATIGDFAGGKGFNKVPDDIAALLKKHGGK